MTVQLLHKHWFLPVEAVQSNEGVTRSSNDTVYIEIINNPLHFIFLEAAGISSAAVRWQYASYKAEVQRWMVKMSAALAEVDCERIAS